MRNLAAQNADFSPARKALGEPERCRASEMDHEEPCRRKLRGYLGVGLRSSGADGLHRIEQARWLEWLGQPGAHTSGFALGLFGVLRFGAEHQYRREFVGRHGFDLAREGQAIQVGHVEVTNDQIEFARLYFFNRFLAVLGLGDLVARLFQREVYHRAKASRIVDNQYRLSHAFPYNHDSSVATTNSPPPSEA
jgi:hypothetical protein